MMEVKNTHHKEKTMGSINTPVEVIRPEDNRRLEKFRTRTIITEEMGKKVIYKCAATDQAKLFIKSIAEREKKNAEYLKEQFGVLCGTLDGDRLKYDYLPYPSLKDELASYMIKGNHGTANELFEKYVNKVRSLRMIQTVPKEFLVKIVKDSSACYCKTDCLSRGLLDITPDNILICKDRWVALDNEWSFDFPVPIVFLIFRAMRALAVTLQPEIRKATSKANPATGIFAGRFRTYYLPSLWMKYITYYDISLLEMSRWEAGFQRYVMGPSYASTLRVTENPRIRTRFSL